MTDLLSLKRDFCEIVKRTQPWILSHFVMWLDLKVSEYKVYGYMLLEQDTEPDAVGNAVTGCPTRTAHSQPKPVSTASSTDDDIDHCLASQQTTCVVMPKSCLSLSPCTGQASEIYVSATPIFKRRLVAGRANRRKQQHVYRRSPASLLSALSGEIHNTVCSLDDRTERFWGVDHTQLYDDVSPTEPCSVVKVEAAAGAESSRLEIQSVESVRDIEMSASGKDKPKDWKDADVESDCCSASRKNVIEEIDLDDDVQVLSSQYRQTTRGQTTDDENTPKHRKRRMSESESSLLDNIQGCIPKPTLPNKYDIGPFKCTSFVSNYLAMSAVAAKQSSPAAVASKQPPPAVVAAKQPSPAAVARPSPAAVASKKPAPDAGKRTLCSKARVKQELMLGELEIKLEPVDTVSVDSSSNSPCVLDRTPDSGHLFQEHQFAYGTGSGTGANPDASRMNVTVNAGSFSQCLDSKRGLRAESDNGQHYGFNPGYSSQRPSRTSTSTPTGYDPSLTCSLCGAGFKFKSSLSRHRALHGEKRYHCFVCPKAFHRREHLLLHLQRHANTAMIACPICSKQTSSVKHLEEHYRLNHGTFIRIGVPPYIAGDQSG